MAYTPPTLDEFLERFPEFEGQDAAIEFALLEAALQVDDSWPDAYRSIGVQLLTAHLVQSGADAASGREIASESIGPFSVSYFKSDKTWQESTGYGVRFAAIARNLFPAVLVV